MVKRKRSDKSKNAKKAKWRLKKRGAHTSQSAKSNTNSGHSSCNTANPGTSTSNDKSPSLSPVFSHTGKDDDLYYYSDSSLPPFYDPPGTKGNSKKRPVHTSTPRRARKTLKFDKDATCTHDYSSDSSNSDTLNTSHSSTTSLDRTLAADPLFFRMFQTNKLKKKMAELESNTDLSK